MDIRPDHLAIVQDILRAHLPAGFKVWVFGSRANWTTKDSSDLDLAVEGAAKLDHKSMSRLEVAFEESDLPYTVDVVDLKAVSSGFRQIVKDQRVLLPAAGIGANVRGEWREGSLGGVIEFKRGYDLPKRDRIPGSVPLVSSSGITDFHAEAKVKGPGVVTGRYGTLGQVFFIPEDFWPLNTALYVRDFKGNDPRFISYFLRSLDFFAYSDKAAVPGLNRNHLHEAAVRYPTDIGQQRDIAHVLGTLDDKIELNRRMNRTLEEMARSIFRDWFVDFGPTRAKMEGLDPYLPPELWNLFPGELVDSELGEIPEGWSVRYFGDLLDDVIGGDWGKESPTPPDTEQVSIIRGTDIPSLRAGGMGSVPTRFTSKKKADRRKLQEGDIIVEVSGGSPTTPTGRSMIVTIDILERFNDTVVCASFCRRLRPSTWIEGMIASQHLDYLNSIGKMWEYQLQSTGISNFQTKRFLEEEQVIWPDHGLATAFASTISPIVRTASGNGSKPLAETRDALLPMLLSGQLRVTGT